MRSSLQIGTFLATVCAVLGAGCTPSRGGGPSVDDGGVPRDAMIPVQTDCTDISPAALPGQPCCLALGVDACGANSVCAQLDGRTIPVCYASSSRTYGETCTEVATGTLCAPAPFGPTYECRETSTGERRCLRPAGWLEEGDDCVDDVECPDRFDCASGQCVFPTSPDSAACRGQATPEFECWEFFSARVENVIGLTCAPIDVSECHRREDPAFNFGGGAPSRAVGSCVALVEASGCSDSPCGALFCSEFSGSWVTCSTYPMCE